MIGAVRVFSELAVRATDGADRLLKAYEKHCQPKPERGASGDVDRAFDEIVAPIKAK